ncbi:ORF V: Enzymatic polyprotein [Labeo rohita]|uniref:ORF V: Enzymatic polyprotein n=1 Tax=Labeo rohita TaxID=84645 RepID=A0ABQ8L9B1_LABRO|nr:ORF V: Enzymatic polyprotein [Labeo rohita]
MELDSVNMRARLTEECAQTVLDCLKFFRHNTVVPLKLFQRLLGHMAATNARTPLGLLHMRLLQHWLHDRVPRWAWHRGTFWVGVTPEYRHLFSPWSDLTFLRAGVSLGQVRRHVIVNTDASSTGWGAVCNGQAASGSWTGPRLQWHINCLELLAVFLALRRFRWMLHGEHVLVRTDNMATVAYINHQGGLRSRRMLLLARHLLLWSLKWLKSLRAVHIPGELNHAADALSRQLTLPGEWRLHPQVVQLIWSRCGGSSVRLSPSEPPCTDLVQDPGGRGAGLAGCALLAHPDLVPGTHAPRNSPSLEDSPEEGPSFSGDGHHLAPVPRSMEPSRLASGRDVADLSGVPQAVIDTITQARVPTTPFRDQVVNLQALPSEEADPALGLLCPVRALCIYVDRTRSFRRSEQLFVCFGGQQRGNAVSKQRLAHWVVDTITLAYQCQGEPCPLGVRAHSTRSVASSWALGHGASLADICRAAGWATPNTFAFPPEF